MRFFVLFILLAASLAATPVRAEEFYVELGRTNTEDEAKAVWAELQPKYKFLANYDVYPNKILLEGGNFSYRVQAGPMQDKKEAERVCGRLFRRKVQCFVIEGFDPKNAETFSGADSDKSSLSMRDFLPWMAPAPTPVPPPAPVKEEKAPEPVAKPSAKEEKAAAKVDVAEAIPVPVTTDAESNEVSIGTGEVTEPAPSIESSVFSIFSSSGWLVIQPFLDEAAAQRFWKQLPQAAAVERFSMKIIHPLVSQDIPKVILALGKFDSETAAMQFCHDFVTESKYLECQFASEPPQGDDTVQKSAVSQDAAAQAQEDENSLFWAEVLSEKSQDKALEKWERIRTDNDDILVNVRSQITSSMARPDIYVVRIGPMKSKAKAGKLCGRLKARGVKCTVTSL